MVASVAPEVAVAAVDHGQAGALSTAPVSALRVAFDPGLDEDSLVGEDDGLDAIPDIELHQDVSHVGSDRRLAEEEVAGDLGVVARQASA